MIDIASDAPKDFPEHPPKVWHPDHPTLPHSTPSDIASLLQMDEPQVADAQKLLLYACEHGLVDVLEYLTREHQEEGKYLTLNADDIRYEDNLPFKTAAEAGQLDVVKFLIESVGLTKADVNAQNKRVLQRCAKFGHRDVVKYVESTYPGCEPGFEHHPFKITLHGMELIM